jgi:dual specificity tyrosine-phosphorylation-regulated kinase 1
MSELSLSSMAAMAGSGSSPAAYVSPLRKLTTGLLTTYKGINARYYAAKKERNARAAAQPAASAPNLSADYVAKADEMLGARYRVIESVGKGSFGQVVSAVDTKEGPTQGLKVAVKIIKAKEAFRKQAKTEIKLLETLNQKDPDDQWCIGADVARSHEAPRAFARRTRPPHTRSRPPPPPFPASVRFMGSFDHCGHTCLVFEHMSFNLYDLLRRTSFKGVSLTLIRKFARQVLKTLAFLRLPEVNIIHCDLKPENILFRAPHRSAIKVRARAPSSARRLARPTHSTPFSPSFHLRLLTLAPPVRATRQCTSTSSPVFIAAPR